MPIYEYQCQACQEQLEVLQKLSDATLLDCPKCGRPSLKKKISAAAFRLKGGGWYETDFKTGNKKNLVGGGEGSATADKPATAGSGDSKPGESKVSAGKPSESTSGDSKKTA
jgi:putative FmdB family regulatory protein